MANWPCGFRIYAISYGYALIAFLLQFFSAVLYGYAVFNAPKLKNTCAYEKNPHGQLLWKRYTGNNAKLFLRLTIARK